MKWLVQEFLNKPENITRVIEALEITSTNYLLIKLNKDDSFTVLDKESKLPLEDSESVLRKFILNNRVMVYGSKTFVQMAKNMKLEPGSFMNEKFEFQAFREVLGDELLNNNFVVDELSNLKPIADTFFIRPTENTKLFTGMTVSKEEFLLWQKRESVKDSPYRGHLLMISPVQEIYSEFRFFVVNQQIVTSSSYKIGSSVDITHKPSKELIEYTKKIIDKFPLANAYVVDIAETKNGCKVVEYNNINSSGLYGCNELEFVKAINKIG